MTDVNNFYPMYQSQEAPTDLGYITDWNHVYQAANVLLAVATNDVWYHEAVQVRLTEPAPSGDCEERRWF